MAEGRNLAKLLRKAATGVAISKSTSPSPPTVVFFFSLGFALFSYWRPFALMAEDCRAGLGGGLCTKATAS